MKAKVLFWVRHQIKKRTNKSYLYRYQLHKIKNRFFNESLHSWINQDIHLSRSFQDFFDRLPMSSVDWLYRSPKILLLRSNAKFSCSLNIPTNASAILVFPDLMKLLRSAAPEYGLAILAHELGHLIHEHALKSIDPFGAQLEADRYAFGLGYGVPLKELLAAEKNQECIDRVKQLENLQLHIRAA